MHVVSRRIVASVAFLAVVIAGCNPVISQKQQALSVKPKYVFLFIGDGMGPEQVKLAEIAAKANGGELRMTQLPVKGQISTHSANRPVTDSAAAGTALATGQKTNNGMLGMVPDGSAIVSVSDVLIDAGMKVGIMSSVPVNHATPGAFYGNVKKRSMYNDIASQLPSSGIHLLAGPRILSENKKQQEIIDAWKAAGIEVVSKVSDAAVAGAAAKIAIIDSNMAKNTQTTGDLSDAVGAAIERLDNPEGFFIMVEGGAIDWAGHDNKAWQNLLETLAFDRAIESAYRFYLERPSETLIIVTADHETGGMSVDDASLNIDQLRQIDKNRKGIKLPKDANDITPEMLVTMVGDVFGITNLTEHESGVLTRATKSSEKKRSANCTRAMINIAQARAGVAWTTGGHTGVNVPVYAIGVGADEFEGTYDNTDIPRKIARLCEAIAPGEATQVMEAAAAQ